jgi:hypothetical protein
VDSAKRDALVEQALAMANFSTQPEVANALRDIAGEVVQAYAANEVTKQHLKVSRSNEDLMSGAAIACIRELLQKNHVPEAAFIDDHVGNAIEQRNKLIECVRGIIGQIDAGTISQIDIKQLIANGLTNAMVDPRVLSNVSEESQENPQAA